MSKTKIKQIRDLKSFYDAEIARLKIINPLSGRLSDLDRYNAWRVAEQHMLNYLLELIIDLKVDLNKRNKKS